MDQQRRRRRGTAQRTAAGPAPAVDFLFDLRSPWTYLAAERVDRCFAAVRWIPALLPEAIEPVSHAAVAARASALRMPLVWPEGDGSGGLAAMRVAACAAAQGRAAAFVLAAARLAYCGGFDLDDPEILAEAAAAACLPLEDCLGALGDRARDEEMLGTGRALRAAGATHLPALRVGGRIICGEERLAEAAALTRMPSVMPLSPGL